MLSTIPPSRVMITTPKKGVSVHVTAEGLDSESGVDSNNTSLIDPYPPFNHNIEIEKLRDRNSNFDVDDDDDDDDERVRDDLIRTRTHRTSSVAAMDPDFSLKDWLLAKGKGNLIT